MKNKWICALLALCLVLPVSAQAVAVESGDEYCFSSREFGENIRGVFLLEVPESGTFRLSDRVLQPGDALTAEQLDQTVFAPDLTEADTQATLRYYPIGEALESETTLSLGIRGKENKPPEAQDSSLETYKNIPNTGKLLAKDPEGEALTYTVTRQPRRGSVEIGAEGSFTYTPKNNKVGVDSFAYTASDPGGKISREATVTITILRPTEPNDYADTEGMDCCFFAQWMRSTGIFSGENLAGELCFQPEKKVTRGELLTMVVKTLGIPLEEDPEPQTLSAYPKWLRPYAAAALRYGLADRGIWQTEDWDSETPASHQEAAELLCAALDLEGEDLNQVLAEKEIALPEEGDLTRAQAANALYKLSKLVQSA